MLLEDSLQCNLLSEFGANTLPPPNDFKFIEQNIKNLACLLLLNSSLYFTHTRTTPTLESV